MINQLTVLIKIVPVENKLTSINSFKDRMSVQV